MGNDNEYGRFCPIAMGSEVIADRWTPLILREMCMGSTRFNDIIRGMPGISRSLLVRRLKHLERQGVLERWPSQTGKGSEYVLTPAGRDLEEVLHAIGRWAIDWFQESLDPTDIDAPTLMWWMHRYVTVDGDGPGRVVVQFDHTDPERLSIWIVCEDGSASVCRQHPGYEPDAVVTASTPALAEVFLGRRTWNDAVRGGDLVVAGPTRVTRSLHRWFPQNFFAPDVKRAMAATA